MANSRQAELHAAADHNPLTADLLGSGETTEVAVLYAPPGPQRLLTDTGDGPGPLAYGEGKRLATTAANLIGAAVYPPCNRTVGRGWAAVEVRAPRSRS